MDVLLPVILLVLAGMSLPFVARSLEQREARQILEEWHQKQAGKMQFGVLTPPPLPEPQGTKVLIVFGVLVVLFGILTVYRHWSFFTENEEDLVFWTWLFLTMVFGLFVQVLANNHQQNLPLFRIEASQLLYPLLFSIVIFYPVWGIAASAPRNFFSFYGAFLNGYFWQNVVAAVKRPAPKDL
jgi:multisubunit Na+/H+ antiporter MnhG subunit